MRVDDWILVQRSSFDIQIGEEPYHSVQVYANLSTKTYFVRVWGKSVNNGKFATVEDLKDLCSSNFGGSVACLGKFCQKVYISKLYLH